ncbi:Tfp pilus assembly protein PilO [Halobacteroides halobius DSM 5150]|uniref:Tfp pilus assembly protein PilO n=1 Tax=Halobacteroides halobius (strain ATCC 35273 / DSM 5150 / MD-1) TaxID=748449 RepID=L0K8V5_HALHC|nr:type 4a pilus biogenesis protein PilO [Halobacteroides halobius]AGB41717.1 Tfp pilus assembly protein PilO [Halobacteroides halobius DSM 5150]
MLEQGLTSREKRLIVMGIVLILSLGSYFYLYQPQLKKIARLEKKIELKIQQLKVKSKKLGKQRNLKREYQRLKKELEMKEKRLLPQNERSKLIIALNNFIFNTRVDLITMTPHSLTEKGRYLKFPITLELKANYQALLSFIKQVERLNYLVKVEALTVSSGLKPNNQVLVNLKLVAYLQ